VGCRDLDLEENGADRAEKNPEDDGDGGCRERGGGGGGCDWREFKAIVDLEAEEKVVERLCFGGLRVMTPSRTP
jgi:hypothetical protein